MKNGRGLNPELLRTMRDDPSKMTPGRQLKDDKDVEICRCAGTRFAAIKCLEGLVKTLGSSDMVRKKRACAQGVLTDVRLLG